MITLPSATESEATAAPQTTAEPPTTAVAEAVVMTDAEIADLERELDEIDQLLAGVDADLAQD